MDYISKENIKQILGVHYNLKTTEIDPLESGIQNLNYLVSTDKCKFVFRLYNWKSIEELRYTIQILHSLQNDNFPSPELILTINNEYSFCFHKKPCILYRYINGERLKEASVDTMKQLGLLQGRMHKILMKEEHDTLTLTWDHGDLLQLMSTKKELLLKSGFPKINNRLEFVTEKLVSMSFPNQLPKGGTHQDIKPENILVSSDQISGIVDFDNGYFGDLLHDVTTTICWFCFKDNKLDLRFVESFVSSYQKERELSEIEKQYLGQSIKFRLLRESIIWPMYVSHNIPIAKKFSDYFLTLYNNYNISETELRRRVN
jgi:Ser/Thr protein kinase RdoA (MazF antagonist)